MACGRLLCKFQMWRETLYLDTESDNNCKHMIMRITIQIFYVENKYFRPLQPPITLHNSDVDTDIMFTRITSLCLLKMYLLK